MQHKVLEIIEFLIKELNEVSEPPLPDIDHLSQKLLEKGYTETDIQKAVDWIVDFMNGDQVTPESKDVATSPNVRILNPVERKIFSKEAHGLLFQYQVLGLLNATQVEQIIDRCFMFGMEKVGVEELKAVVAPMLLGKETAYEGSHAIFSPGNEKIH